MRSNNFFEEESISSPFISTQEQKRMIAEDIYDSYPRHVGVRQATAAIEKALQRLKKEESKHCGHERPEVFLARKTRLFAESSAGQFGKYTPYPATWFNQSRYLDDPREWEVKFPKFGENKYSEFLKRHQ